MVRDGEVLVRVHAASVHVGDRILIRGLPYFLRMATGPRKPKHRVPGWDIAGTVEADGKDATQLRPGDAVLGWCTGAFAEYACAGADHFVPKPANLTFEQTAAVDAFAADLSAQAGVRRLAVVRTNFGAEDQAWFFALISRVVRPLLKTPAQGAQTPIYLAASPDMDGVTGTFFANRTPKTANKVAYDTDLPVRLWQVSADLLGMTPATP